MSHKFLGSFILVLTLLMVSCTAQGPIDWVKCTPKNLCERILCPEITECKELNQEIELKGSLCGCCDACVEYLDKGDINCDEARIAPNGKNLRKCKAGLKCESRKCVEETDVAKLPLCVKVRNHREALVKNHANFDKTLFAIRKDLWMPDCDNQGYFKSKQCKDKKCMCLSKEGDRIFGNAEKELSNNMTCDCSVAVFEDKKLNEAAWMTKPHLRCTQTGDYEELQCYENLCFCADQKTGKPKGQLVLLDHYEFLPCYKQKSDNKDLTYLTKCEKQEMRESKVNYEFFLKGITIQGSKTVTCDIDGTFSARQCDAQACYCTDRNSTSLKSYKIDRAGRDETKMHCRCSRDEHDNELNHARFPVLKCGQEGNFDFHQCFSNDCYCVDEDGDYITDRMDYYDELPTVCREKAREFQLDTIINTLINKPIKPTN